MEKKGLLAKLIVCLWVFLLAGCQVFQGGSQATPSVEAATPTTSAGTPTQTLTPAPSLTPTEALSTRIPLNSLKGVTLVFWQPYLDEMNYWLQVLVGEFNDQNPYGITVQMTSQGNPAEEYRQVQAMLPGSYRSNTTTSLPDVVIAYPEQALSWEALSPVLVDLTGYIQDPAAGLTSDDLADFYSPWWKLGTVGTSQYGIPAMGEMQVLYYNQTWAQKLGFTNPPTTQSELATQACAAAQANRKDATLANDGTGGWLVDTTPLTLLNWLSAFGGSILSTQGQFTFNSTANVSAFSAIQSLIGKNCAWSGNATEPYDYFASHEALFTSGSLEQIPNQLQAFKNAQSSDTWTVIAMPGSNGKSVVTASGSNYYILSTSAVNQMAAWLFVRWMSSAQNQSVLVEQTSSFPLRASELTLLSSYKDSHPQWAAALALISAANPQPVNADWRVVQNLLQDAGMQLVSAETKATQVPGILSDLDQSVAGLIESTAASPVTPQAEETAPLGPTATEPAP